MYTVIKMLRQIQPTPTQNEQVYATLREAVVGGTLAPGEEVIVSALATQLGVSRIPVMQACQRLVGEGFLLPNPRRSLTVAPMTEERILDGSDVLTALECLALDLAAPRCTAEEVAQWRALNAAGAAFRRPPGAAVENVADSRFHAALWRAAGRPYLYQQISLVYDHHEPARALSRPTHDQQRASREHEQIVDALARGDATAAQETLRRHRRNGAQRAIAALRALRAAAEGAARAPTPGRLPGARQKGRVME
jgi:DNA-binding GntR family transcriptional regulator